MNDLVSVIRIALAADLAHKESEKKSQRLRETKGQQRQAALEGKPINKILPFWLARNKYGYCFSERLETVKRIVNLKQSGHGSNKIAQILNKEGYKALRSGEWNHTTIIKTIKNPALYGAYQTTETTKDRKVIKLDLIENYFPAVISKDEWMLLQSDHKKDKSGYRSPLNAYTGLLKCECGGALARQFQTYKGKRYSYHICTNRHDSRNCSLTKSIKNLEDGLSIILGKLELKKTKKLDNSILVERNDIQQKIQNLDEMLLTVSKVPASVITTIGNLENKLSQLDLEIQTHRSTERSEQSVELDRLSSVKDPVELNMLLKRVLKEITVTEMNKGWRVAIKYFNGHSQGFLWKDDKINFLSDTKKLLDYLESIKEF
ncbi:recombinase family protein [Serratia nevei]